MLFTGDWFLLMQMAKHIRPTVMYHLMLDLRDKLDKKRASNGDDDQILYEEDGKDFIFL